MRFRRKKRTKKKKEQENGLSHQDKQTSVGTPPRSQSADNLTSTEGETIGTPSSTSADNIPDTPTCHPASIDHAETSADTPTANGDMKVGSGVIEGSASVKTPPPERKASKLSAFSRLFKPWKWRKRKKPSEKIEKTAVDLERKISVRTSREELIKRGVLREVDENGEPITAKETTIPEEDEVDGGTVDLEAVKEGKAENEHKHTNGSAASTPTLPFHTVDGDLPNSITAGEELQRPESVVVEPKHIRVMLPVEDKDRQVPVLQKIPVFHEPPDYTPLPPPDHQFHRQQNSPVIVSSSYSHSPMLNNNIYSPTGLMYPTPTLKSQTLPAKHCEEPYSATTPTVTEVPINEPDLSKRPLRSALKGAKSKQLLQQQLQQRLQEKQRQLQHAETVTTSSRIGFVGHNGSLSRAPPKVAPKPKVSLVNAVRVIDPNNKENVEMYDNIPDYDYMYSDSDEEVQYDERDREAILAAKVLRQDSLARFLHERPDRNILIERNIIPCISDIERQRERDLIGHRLTRRLSLRPTVEELENRNILHSKSTDDYYREKEEKKKTLIRKLSFRPTVDELKGRKIILFSDYVAVTDANEYDRRADKPWTRLTPKDKAAIRKELNQFKSAEMDVHDESRHLTRFHRP